MEQPRISTADARSMALQKQGLTGEHSLVGVDAIHRAARRVGVIQLDSANVVERSHYLSVFSRTGTYERAQLDSLVHPAGRIVEQWTHCASLIPVEDCTHFWPIVMARRNEPLSERKKATLGSGYAKALEAIYDQVQLNGPTRARDFTDGAASKQRTWWNKKPASVALARLAYLGRLAVSHRIGFEPVYDLAERVLTKPTFSLGAVDLHHTYRWVVARSLGCMGTGTAQQVADYYRQPVRPIRAAIDTLVEDGKVLEVRVPCWHQPAFVLKNDMEALETERSSITSTTTLLSPFDSLIWHRARTVDLFGFEFKNEMYTPLKQRQRVHGYFVMPILHMNALVGRVDLKVDRKTRTLILQRLSLETAQRPSELIAPLVQLFREFMKFTGARVLQIVEGPSAQFNRSLQNQCS